MLRARSSGILLHPSSLPGRFGIGDLGSEAFRFIDFLKQAGQSLWQILPLGPTGYGDSPYSTYSAFAGNPLLVSLELLLEQGDLLPEDLDGQELPQGNIDFGEVHDRKERLLHRAAERFLGRQGDERHQRFDAFCRNHEYWLEDYSLFRVLRRHFGQKHWNLWPEPERLRDPEALQRAREELAQACAYHRYAQFVFFEQWQRLKEYAAQNGISILGDIPIYVAEDSCDVWANPHLYHLDDRGAATEVAGVPPDYFSETGQRWGNPMYRWDRMEQDGFGWWIARLRHNLGLTDALRIDHFRGLESAWSIPADSPTAVDGRWVAVPGDKLLQKVAENLGEIPLVAEDLGVITPEVEKIRDDFGLPGMKILQFAFGSGSDNPYLPHNVERNCLIYTGTHDNNTSLGWWQGLGEQDRAHVASYIGKPSPNMPEDLIRLAMAGVAGLCILPLQDLLGLDGSGRMNTPGKAQGNWCWRYEPGALKPELARRLHEMTAIYGRLPAKSDT